jgi:hypothetical protein
MPALKNLIVLVLIFLAFIAQADENSDAAPEEDSKSSPWLFSPIFSSDPKLSTATGALVGYVHKFDEESPPSIFGLTGTYNTTSSWYIAAFAQTFFGQDKHRLGTAIVTGQVHNEYANFLESGVNAETTDDFGFFCGALCL